MTWDHTHDEGGDAIFEFEPEEISEFCDSLFDFSCKAAREAKQELVALAGQADLDPHMFWLAEKENRLSHIDLPPIVPTAIGIVICSIIIRETHGSPRMVMCALEAYTTKRDTLTSDIPLSMRYAEGDPDVLETLIMCMSHRTVDGVLQWRTRSMPYRYPGEKDVEFLDGIAVEMERTGPIRSAIESQFTVQGDPSAN